MRTRGSYMSPESSLATLATTDCGEKSSWQTEPLHVLGRLSGDSFNRMPYVMAMGMAAILFSQPLGMKMQKHITTDGDPADLEVLEITRREMRPPLGGTPMTVHRVNTRAS